MKETEAKEAINTLELWLRNVIDSMLREAYGDNYFHAKNKNNQSIIKKEVREHLELRIKERENRYPRKVDALLLEEEMAIICHPELYKKHFVSALKYSYPEGNNVLRTTLKQLIPIRNKLFHSNPISTREYEKIICYSHDVVDSIKEYYKKSNMKKEYNVPSILSMKDSLGNVIHSNQFNRIKRSRAACTDNMYKNNTLYVGDHLEVTVAIDETFPQDFYDVKWLYKNTGSVLDIKEQTGKIFKLKLLENHIREQFHLECIVKSHKSWHRFTDHDDLVVFNYKVLPIP